MFNVKAVYIYIYNYYYYFRCTNSGYLAALLDGQRPDVESFNNKLCGPIPKPDVLVSSKPRLLLVFDTRNAIRAGKGFRARYQFITGGRHATRCDVT